MRRLVKFGLAAGLALLLSPGAYAQSAGGDAGVALHQLFDDEQAFSFREGPLSATAAGVHDYDDHLGSASPETVAREDEANKTFLSRLHAIDRAKLNITDQLSYDLFDFMIASRVRFAPYHTERIPMESDSGFHTEILQIPDLLDLVTTKDYENYIARLRDVPRYFDENIANMRQG